MYLGGHPSIQSSYESGSIMGNRVDRNFVGCIDDLHIDGVYVDLRRTPFIGDVVEGYGVGELEKCPRSFGIFHK